MTNLVGQPLSKSEQTRTGAKIRLEIDPTARDPGSLEEEAVRRERSPAEREVRSRCPMQHSPGGNVVSEDNAMDSAGSKNEFLYGCLAGPMSDLSAPAQGIACATTCSHEGARQPYRYRPRRAENPT
jgi:hypothetical protein